MRTTVVILLLVTILTAQGFASRDPLFVVVVIDTSWTVSDFETYQTAYDQILSDFGPGDAMVVVLAKGRVLSAQPGNSSVRGAKQKEIVGGTRLREIERLTVERCTINRAKFECEDELESARTALTTAFRKALSQPRSDRTELLFTTDEVANYFADTGGRKPVLVFLSDMLEDSSEARFELSDPTPEFTQHYISSRGQNGMPHLQNVRIFVAGAAAKTEVKRRHVAEFWLKYLAAAGADIRRENYGSLLFGFNYGSP
jgi:hypothetical protein